MLFCQTCAHVVPPGLNQCQICGNGYTSQLVCTNCQLPVERGASACASCRPPQPGHGPRAEFEGPSFSGGQPQGNDGVSVTVHVGGRGAGEGDWRGGGGSVDAGHMNSSMIPRGGGPMQPAIGPGFTGPGGVLMPARIPDSYHLGKFETHGVQSQVFNNVGDVDIMNDMGKFVMMLHAMAERMSGFTGTMESTRRCIRNCRVLAADLQEEIEIRRGRPR